MFANEEEQNVKTDSLKLYISFILVSVVSVPVIFFLMFSQIIPFTSKLPYHLSMLIIALFSSLFAIVILILIFVVAVPLSGQKVDPRMKHARMWFVGWIFITIVACSNVFFSYVYDRLFPSVDSDFRSILSPLTVLLVFLVLASPPLRDRTTRFFEKAFGTEKTEK